MAFVFLLAIINHRQKFVQKVIGVLAEGGGGGLPPSNRVKTTAVELYLLLPVQRPFESGSKTLLPVPAPPGCLT